MSQTKFSDEALTAYLDGALDSETEERLSAALETDDDLVDRLQALDIPVAEIRAEYDALLSEAPPMPALPEVAKPKTVSRFAFGTFGMGLAAGLAIAAVGGVLLWEQPEAPKAPGWKAVVASYQALYSEETLAAVTPSQDEQDAQIRAATAAIGLDLAALPAAEGLSFKRAQILEFRGRPLAQITYLRADGAPVALCILPVSDPASKPMLEEQLNGMAAVSWNENGFGYLLIGGSDEDGLDQSADTFQAWSRT